MDGSAPQVLPLPEEGKHSLTAWKQRIAAAFEKLEPVTKQGKVNVQAYKAKTLGAYPKDDTYVAPLDFAYAEQKKAQLFPRSPEIILTPKYPGLEDPTVVFQAVVNDMLGPHEMHAKVTMSEVVTDIEMVGFGAVKIGYENAVEGVRPVIDPATGQPAVDPMTGAPQTVPNIVYECYTMERISPARVGQPHDFSELDSDKADWLCFKYFEDVDGDEAKGVSKASDASEETLTLSDEAPLTQHIQTTRRECVEVWYRACKFDPAVKHPELFRQLILKHGMDTPAVHRDSPYQRYQNGQVLGMKGNPIHLFKTRYISDCTYPPSDISLIRGSVDAVSKGHSQMFQQRERSVPMRWADKNRITEDQLNAVLTAKTQKIILTDGPGTDIVGEVARAEFPRENFEFDRIFKEDAAAVMALQVRGANEDQGRTATEASYKKQTTDDRMDDEREMLLDSYCKAVAKAAALKQLFADATSYVRIVGPTGEQRLQAWDKTAIAGEYVFSVRPDSAVRVDIQTERKQNLDLYNLTANDPNINRVELGRKLTTSYGLDPSRVMQQPPPQTPEPPKLTLSIKMDDFVLPQGPVTAEIAAQMGLKISPQAIQMAMAMFQQAQQLAAMASAEDPEGNKDTPHGGPAEGLEPVSKHSASLSGKLSGPGPM